MGNTGLEDIIIVLMKAGNTKHLDTHTAEDEEGPWKYNMMPDINAMLTAKEDLQIKTELVSSSCITLRDIYRDEVI